MRDAPFRKGPPVGRNSVLPAIFEVASRFESVGTTFPLTYVSVARRMIQDAASFVVNL